MSLSCIRATLHCHPCASLRDGNFSWKLWISNAISLTANSSSDTKLLSRSQKLWIAPVFFLVEISEILNSPNSLSLRMKIWASCVSAVFAWEALFSLFFSLQYKSISVACSSASIPVLFVWFSCKCCSLKTSNDPPPLKWTIRKISLLTFLRSLSFSSCSAWRNCRFISVNFCFKKENFFFSGPFIFPIQRMPAYSARFILLVSVCLYRATEDSGYCHW